MAINLTPTDPTASSMLPRGNIKWAESKNTSESSQTSPFFGKHSTSRGIIKSMGYSAQNPKMDTVTLVSIHWFGWSQSASVLSVSPERHQPAPCGEKSLNFSHFANQGFVFHLITTESISISGDSLDRLPARNLQHLIGQN